MLPDPFLSIGRVAEMKGISGRSSSLDNVAIDRRETEGSLSVVVDEEEVCSGAPRNKSAGDGDYAVADVPKHTAAVPQTSHHRHLPTLGMKTVLV